MKCYLNVLFLYIATISRHNIVANDGGLKEEKYTYLPEDKATSFKAINKLSPSIYAKDKFTQPIK